MTEQAGFPSTTHGLRRAERAVRGAQEYPLHPLQREMLLGGAAEPRPGSDCRQVVCTLAPGLDVEGLRHAWQRVIDRHCILRTSFHRDEGREPWQRVHRRVETPFELVDWSHVPESELLEHRRRWLLADRRIGFDVTRAPCMRLTIARLPHDRHVVLWSFHRLLVEGRALLAVLTDLFSFYEGVRSGREPELPEARPFSEYVEHSRGRDHGPAREIWRRILAGASPTPIAVARPRLRDLADDESPSGRSETRLSREIGDRLREVAVHHDVTPSTLLMTAWAIVLSRYGGGRDVVFGANRSGWHSDVPDADPVVGAPANTLPIRARLAPDDVVARVAGQLRDLSVATRPFAHTPLTQALEAAGRSGGAPLFESVVVAERGDLGSVLRERAGGLLEPGFEVVEWTDHPMTVMADLRSEIALSLEYDRRRFDDAAPARMLGHLATVLESLAGGLERAVRDVPMMRPEERRELLAERNATDAPFDEAACIHQLFERQAAMRPDAPAVSSGGQDVTFAELWARAGRIAVELRAHGVGSNVPVGLCLERGADLVAAVLGILRAGGAYVPLDPDRPEERLRQMIEETAVRVVLTDERSGSALPDGDFTRLAVGREGAGVAPSAPDPGVRPDDAACILHPSGATDRPKGVVVTHGGLVNHATHMVKALGLGPGDRVAQSASMSSDLALLELFATWAAGATVVMRPGGGLASSRLGPWLGREKITVAHLPTALWQRWVSDLVKEGRGLPPTLRLVLVKGESASSAAVDAFRELGEGRVRWVQLYGPTECTVNATLYEPDLGAGPDAVSEDVIPVGRPIANTRVYVLDERLEPVPVGVPGRVYIGGRGVARGYHGSPEATAERFLPDPFVGRAGMRMVRTTDLARWREGGHLELVGRADRQVEASHAARYVAPRGPVEETLAGIFARVLGAPRVGIHDSFFDLGGQSLLALRILDELGRAGLSLTVEDLFEHPTVAELAPLVSVRSTGPGRWSSLVALRRTGERRPLFLLHAAPGDLLGYADLVRALGPSQPCFGFQSLGLYELAQAHIHIEEMAAHYAELLTRHQAQGPYDLAGWGQGGVVAFEMARQLVRAGRRVGLLALVDSPAPRAGLGRIGWWADRARAVARLDKRTLARRVAGRVRARMPERMRGAQERDALPVENDVVLGPFANRGLVSESNLQALRAYRPRFYSGELTLIRCAEPPRDGVSDPWLGWRTLAAHMEAHTVDAPTHEAILSTPHVDEVASIIRSRIGSAGP